MLLVMQNLHCKIIMLTILLWYQFQMTAVKNTQQPANLV